MLKTPGPGPGLIDCVDNLCNLDRTGQELKTSNVLEYLCVYTTVYFGYYSVCSSVCSIVL